MEQSTSSMIECSPDGFLAFYESHLEHYRKYPRYRMTEIRLTFALEAIRHRLAHYIAEGKAVQDAMLQAIEEFHEKIESLVLEEFAEFFRDMTTLDELHKQLSARSKAGH